ncbi:MAG TPA: nicotinate-nicotinamide nucleotide adenylyltransferase [Candidatus Saccharimonadales bacterium]
MSSKRIGIYAGTFDPVHSGHVTFALQALQAAGLDKVYFLPERRPRNKQHVAHFGHRVAMLRRALKPHPQFDALELVDVSFSVERTLPELQREFKGDQLVFLFGSDVLRRLRDWPDADRLLSGSELVIGLRAQDDRQELHRLIEAWPTQPKALTMFASYAPDVSSGRVREALRRHQSTSGLLSSVERYSDRNWLYVSLDPLPPEGGRPVDRP